MTRRPTYGERMARWEREHDEWDEQVWQGKLNEALMTCDTEKVDMLVMDGLNNSYSFEPFRNEHLIKYFLKKYL